MNKLIVILFVSLSIHLSAYELVDLYELGYEHDDELKKVKLNNENRVIDWEKSQLKEKFKVSVGGKGSKSSLTDNILVTPMVSFSLGDKINTQISIETPLNINLSDPVTTNIPIDISINQPLNGILGISNESSTPILENNLSNKIYEVDIISRKIEIKDIILHLLKELIDNNKELYENENTIKIKSDDLKAQTLTFNINKESTSYLRKELEIRKLKRSQNKLNITLEQTIKKLQLITGVSLSENNLELILKNNKIIIDDTLASLKNNTKNEIIGLRRQISRVLLDETKESKAGEYSINGNFKSNNDDSETINSLSAGVTTTFEDFSITGSVEHCFEEKENTLSLGFNWSPKDNRDKKLNISRLENDFKLSKIEEDSSRKNIKNQIDLILLEIDNLFSLEESLIEDQLIISRQVMEYESWYKNGLISKIELDEVLVEDKKIKYDIQILNIDKLILKNKIEGIK